MRMAKQRGDTIVEVVMAIAVVAVMLTGAYASASRSLNNTRAAQERGEALKVLEGQLENLNTLSKADSPPPATNIYDASNTVFCLNDVPARVNFTSYDPSTVPLSATDFSKYPAGCTVGLYSMSISYNPGEDDFTIITRWERVNGGRDEISDKYRVHKSSGSSLIPRSLTYACSDGVDNDSDGKTDFPADPDCVSATDDDESTPAPPPPPSASGTLSCSALNGSSIGLNYTYSNASNVSIFRDNNPTAIHTAASSPGSFTDSGRSPNTSYTYRLRNGTNPTDTLLDSATCSIPSAVTGAINSCSQPGGAFDNVYIDYNFSGAASVSLLRDGVYLATLNVSSGTYTDLNGINGGTVQQGTTYRYSLDSGGVEIASCSITTATFSWNGCLTGCTMIRRELWIITPFVIS